MRPRESASVAARALEVTGAPRRAAVLLSLVVPAYDEAPNLERLHERIRTALGDLDWELVVVDDGSRDATRDVLRELVRRDPRVRGIVLTRNEGQTAATAVGIRYAAGGLIATLDADLQNDPADLPAMIAKLEGHDAVVGYRVERNDTWLRRLSSTIANGVRNRVSGDRIRDTGCSLKVFRAEALRSIPLFEGMHRFLPTLIRFHGGSVLEHPVSHHPRTAGRSKYGIRNRVWRASKDLLAVRWMRDRILRARVEEVIDAP